MEDIAATSKLGNNADPSREVASASRLPARPKPLSCISCRQHKVKCDRGNPCGRCRRSGLDCIFPQRVRKARQGTSKRDTELLQRISRLETLVKKVGGETAEDLFSREEATDKADGSRPGESLNISSDTSSPKSVTRTNSSGPISSRYLSGAFWSTLGDEVDGLKLLLEHPSDDEDELDSSSPSVSEGNQEPSPTFMFGYSPTPSEIKQLPYTSEKQAKFLYNQYFTCVDPIFKILHQPTIGIMFWKTEEVSKDITKAFQALRYAMYFAAATSMSTEESLKEFGRDRDSLLGQYKIATETALAEADFLNSMDIMSLQAFVLYVMCLRTHSRTRASWTLLSVALRIAQSLGLHRDGDGSSYSPFEAEIRRRLWWRLFVLDVRASEDRGTEPMITASTFNTRMPYNINDSDISPQSHEQLVDSPGITSETFGILTADISLAIARVNYAGPVNPIADKHEPLSYEEKEVIVKECSQRVDTLLARCNLSIPLQWSMVMIGKGVICTLWLLLQYPLQKQPSVSHPRFARDQILRISVSILEIMNLLDVNSVVSGYSWMFETYVPWHPLAVALVMLCSETEGPLVERAWLIVDTLVEKTSERIADEKEGMLWRPIKKLLKKAQAARLKVAAPTLSNLHIPDSVANVSLASNQPTIFESSQLHQFPSTPDTMGQSTFNNDMPWAAADINMFPEADVVDNTMNWEDWNEFILDAGESSAAVPQLPTEMFDRWPM